MRWYSLFLLTSISALAAVEPLRCFQASDENGSFITLRLLEQSHDSYQIQIDSPDASGLTLPAMVFDRLSEDSPDEANKDFFSWRQKANIITIEFDGKQESGTITLSIRSLMEDDACEFVGNYIKISCA